MALNRSSVTHLYPSVCHRGRQEHMFCPKILPLEKTLELEALDCPSVITKSHSVYF